MSLFRQKIEQAMTIVAEENVSAWMTIGRETSMNSDPAIGLICPVEFGGMTAVIVTPQKAICIAGHLDSYGMSQTGVFDEVREYDKSFKEFFFSALRELSPKVIALNYSDDVAADGLGHGLFLQVEGWLNEFGYSGEVISAERIIGKLRGRKSEEEVNRIKKAIAATEQILLEAKDFIKADMSQKTIHAWCQTRIAELGFESAWDAGHNPGVMLGWAPGGHAGPGEHTTRAGHLLTLDFGVKVEGYCADIQRVYYILGEGESDVPQVYKDAFADIQASVEHGTTFMMPGRPAYTPDEAVRQWLKERDYPECNFAFGHQVGRSTHDGGLLMGPRWERYAGRVEGEMETNMVFTIDVNLGFEHGRIGQEDMAIITDQGGVRLSGPQPGIYICNAV